MTDVLSEKVKLKVNTLPIALGEAVSAETLNNHGIKKVGFFGRLMLQSKKGEVIYWSKNATLGYIDDNHNNSIMPILDKDADPRHKFGTSTYLHIEYNILTGFAFQIVNNPEGANIILKDFEEKIVGIIDRPDTDDPKTKTWKTDDQKLIVDYPGAGKHGYIHLLMDNE